MSMHFDNHKYAKRLEAAGMTPALADIQAETTGEIMREIHLLNSKLDTLSTSTNARFDTLNTNTDARFARTDAKIDLFESRLETKIAESRAELVRWVVGVGIMQTALIAAMLLKLTH